MIPILQLIFTVYNDGHVSKVDYLHILDQWSNINICFCVSVTWLMSSIKYMIYLGGTVIDYFSLSIQFIIPTID